MRGGCGGGTRFSVPLYFTTRTCCIGRVRLGGKKEVVVARAERCCVVSIPEAVSITILHTGISAQKKKRFFGEAGGEPFACPTSSPTSSLIVLGEEVESRGGRLREMNRGGFGSVKRRGGGGIKTGRLC